MSADDLGVRPMMTSRVAVSPWRGWSANERRRRRPLRDAGGHAAGSVAAAVDAIEAPDAVTDDAGEAADVAVPNARTDAPAGTDGADAGSPNAEGETTADAMPAGDDADSFELEIDGRLETLKADEIAEAVRKLRAGDGGAEVEAIRAEVDATRRQLAAENTRFVEEVAAATLQKVNYLATMVDALCPQAPDLALLRTDPDSYHEQKAVHELFEQVRRELLDEAHAAHAVAGRAGTQAAQLTAEEQQQFIEREQRHMLDAMPELREPAKAQAFLRDAATYIRSVGYAPDDLAQITDHRLFRILKDAMAHRAGDAKTATIRRKLANKPPVARTPGGQFTGVSPRAAELEQRVKAGHNSLRDVAALIDAIG